MRAHLNGIMRTEKETRIKSILLILATICVVSDCWQLDQRGVLPHDSSWESSFEGSEEEEGNCTVSGLPSAPPQNVSLEPESSTSLILRWEAPPKEPEQCAITITGYKIKYKLKGTRKAEVILTEGNQRVQMISGLTKGANYMVRVAAMTKNGTGPQTEWHSAETYVDDLQEDAVPPKPQWLRVRPTATAVTVSWAPPPRDSKIMIRGYTIGWGIGIPDVYTKVLESGKHRSYTIENLQPSAEYVISLRAYNRLGDGLPIYETVKTLIESPSESSAPILPPVGLKAVVLSSSTIILSWTDATLRNAQIPDNRYYVVRYTKQFHSPSPRYHYLNSTDLSIMVDSLRPNTQYEFSVKVVRGRRESTWSMSVINETQETAPSSAPRDLTVVPSANDDPSIIRLNWQPPKEPNGQITGYLIFFHTDNKARERDWQVEGVVGDKLTATIKGLQPDTQYFFKIQARNSKGYGPISNEIPFTTLPGRNPL